MGVVPCSVLFRPCSYGRRLAMPAAVTATAVEAATTVEAAPAAVDSSATVETATGCPAPEAAADCSASCEAAAPVKATSAPAWAKATSAPTTSAPPAVEPRACSDEQAAGEVARTVVAVRRTGVGVIPIVAVSADGSWTDIPWANADTHRKALSAGVWSESQGRSKYRKNHEIFHEMFHIWAPSEPVEPF